MRALAVLAFLVNFIVAQEILSKDCKIPAGQNFPAPVFSDGENLSFPKCGHWDKQKSEFPPWRVYLLDLVGGGGCFAGILLSPTLVFSAGYFCSKVTDIFINAEVNNSRIEAHLGKCLEGTRKHNCTFQELGRILKVESAKKLHVPNSDGFTLWKIQKVDLAEHKFWPLCLFNKNNHRDLQQSNKYEVHQEQWVISGGIQFVPNLGSCLREEITTAQCARMNSSICLTTEEDFKAWLVYKDSDRFFLRGVFDLYGRGKHEIYTDLLPFVDQIVLK